MKTPRLALRTSSGHALCLAAVLSCVPFALTACEKQVESSKSTTTKTTETPEGTKKTTETTEKKVETEKKNPN